MQGIPDFAIRYYRHENGRDKTLNPFGFGQLLRFGH